MTDSARMANALQANLLQKTFNRFLVLSAMLDSVKMDEKRFHHPASKDRVRRATYFAQSIDGIDRDSDMQYKMFRSNELENDENKACIIR